MRLVEWNVKISWVILEWINYVQITVYGEMVMCDLVKSLLICCYFQSGQLQLKFKSFGFFNRELGCEFQTYQDTAIVIVGKK